MLTRLISQLAHVELYTPAEPPSASPGRVVLGALPLESTREPYPGWEPRWDWLRGVAR